RDGGEIYIAGCRAEGAYMVPSWEFVNSRGIHLTHTMNEGHGEAKSLYLFKDCRGVVVESTIVASADRGYVVMMGSADMKPETTGPSPRGAPTLTFSHTA